LSTGSSRSLVVVTAGLGQPSSTRLLSDRLTAAVERHLRDAGVEPSVSVVELRDHAQDLMNHLLTGFPAPSLQAVIDSVLGADALIAATPIFSASYSSLFKMFFDVVERGGLAGMPVLIAATGGSPRHALALDHAMRPLFAYFNAAVMPTGVYAASDDWGSGEKGTDGSLVERIDRAGQELATAMTIREPRVRQDRYANPVAFERLLHGDPPPDR